MKNLYFECNFGISGDMAVAAMLDAGADEDELLRTLKTIPADGFTVKVSRVQKNGIYCMDFNVVLDSECENHDHDMKYLFETDWNEEKESFSQGEHKNHGHSHRTMAEITPIIEKTKMTSEAQKLALRIFGIIAEAESVAHGIPVEKVHFHETGAIDSIVDVIALSVCFENLKKKFGIEKVFVPYLCEGRGTVRCQHGILPVPVPAVVNIAQKYSLPLSFIEEQGEFVTPTGAAFIAAVASDFCIPKNAVILKCGLGAGKRTYRRPSIIRAFIMEESNSEIQDEVVKLESIIDDCSGEALGFTAETLMKHGALDVHFVPCYMKKNRPAYILNVLCSKEIASEMEKIIFFNTTTIGIRHSVMERTVLLRRIQSVETKWGSANVKIVSLYGSQKIYPEYESVRGLCEKTGLNFDFVYGEILNSAKKILAEQKVCLEF